jgi:hypothetical protein
MAVRNRGNISAVFLTVPALKKATLTGVAFF